MLLETQRQRIFRPAHCKLECFRPFLRVTGMLGTYPSVTAFFSPDTWPSHQIVRVNDASLKGYITSFSNATESTEAENL